MESPTPKQTVDEGPVGATKPGPVPWYQSPTLRVLTGYAAVLIVSWASHRQWAKNALEAGGLDVDTIHNILDGVVQLGGLALTGWIAKKRIDRGNNPASPAAPIETPKVVQSLVRLTKP